MAPKPWVSRHSYPWPQPSPTPSTTPPPSASAIFPSQRKRFSAVFSSKRVKYQSENLARHWPNAFAVDLRETSHLKPVPRASGKTSVQILGVADANFRSSGETQRK